MGVFLFEYDSYVLLFGRYFAMIAIVELGLYFNGRISVSKTDDLGSSPSGPAYTT